MHAEEIVENLNYGPNDEDSLGQVIYKELVRGFFQKRFYQI